MQEMTEALCLSDLRSPPMQAVANRLDAERIRLVSRLTQMPHLRPDIAAAEVLLKAQTLQVSSQGRKLSQVRAWFDGLKNPRIPDTVWLGCQTA